MATAEIIAEHEFTVDKLETLFKRAFFSTSIDSDGDVVVQTDGPRVCVIIKKDKKLLKFMSIYGVKTHARLEAKHALANKLNDDYIFARFSIPDSRSDVLVADYYLPFEGGIPEFQVVAVVRLFSRVVPGAIRACDTNDLVE